MTSSLIGGRLGKYEVTEILGEGGMAMVYKAYHRELERFVAIKVLPPHPGRDPRYVERIRMEARVIARLSHPHILSLYDFDTQDDVLYLVMAYVDGGSLRELLREGELPLQRIETIVQEVASALDYAHRQGVIHRDIKPGNILLNNEGHTLLADFGIAKLVDSTATLTETGGVVGTPTYMPPEQSFGEEIDQRADVYSLGAVVFELLAGRPPYVSSNALRMIAKHLNDPIPRIDEMRGGLPSGLTAVMQRVLAKSPDERYQTVRDFSAAFRAAIHDADKMSSRPVVPVNSGNTPQAAAFEDMMVEDQRTRVLVQNPTNLPAQLTSFIGREQEVMEICQRLRQPNLRLLTLAGPGGIGKTRLSIEVGTNLLSDYKDGVYFIALAPLATKDAVVKAIAQALNLQEDTSGSLLDSIKAHVKSYQVLFIFDNFEHLLDEAAILSELLTTAPNARVLVTSRESLFIYGEHVYNVPTLSLPGQEADILQSSASRLFVERIQAVNGDFVPTTANTPYIVNICRQLDGLPLALELAAARLRDLTLQQISEQLTDRLALLSKGPRDLPVRQRTMRGAIEWSYQLLSADEQRAFARLGVFEGQFFAEAAQEVTGIPDLMVFRSKSLIQVSAEQTFSLLAVLREFAIEQLARFGELDPMRQRHGEYYCRWLEAAQYHLNGPDQIEWFGRLQVEQHNFQAALEWFIEQGMYEFAGRMVAVLWRYWATQSLLSEGAHWNDEVMAHSQQLSPLVHAGVARGAGRLALLRHEYAHAIVLQQTSLALYKSSEDLPGQAAVLLSLGETEYVQGAHVQAEIFLGESLSIFRMLDDEAGIGRCLNIMGKIVMQNGDFAKAEPLLRESLILAQAHGSTEGVALALYDLAGVLRAQTKYAEAEHCYRESLALFRELNFAVGVATQLYNLGFTLQAQGDYAAATANFVEALKLLQTLDEPIAIAECLIGMAGRFLHEGKGHLCIQTLSGAQALLNSVNAQGQVDYVDLAEYARIYEASHAENPEWQAAWTAGQSLPLEQIINFVLNAV